MTSLYSPRWHRVAALKPRLAPHVRLRRQRQRGQTWHLLADPAGGRSVRLNAAAYAIAGRLDGERTLQQLWDGLLAAQSDPPTQDEVIDVLAQLREASLVQLDRPADFDRLLPHLDSVRRPRGRGTLLAWRLPLANPSALLERLGPLQRVLCSRPAFALWSLSVAMLVVQALQHAPELWAHGELWMATPRFALLAMLLYVPIKLLHELAHALAVSHWGGQVREAGVTLMLLMPVPYVDAAAASGFERRRQRIAVGAAGMMAELGLASIALPLWLWLDDGLARDAAFVTLVIAGVSTLLFNANPLQRLDGYYIFTDALDLPNLGPRSRGWWLDLLRRRLLRSDGAEPMPVARGEAPWLAAYAPLSWLYGLGIAALAVLWLGQLSKAIGLLCGLLLAWQMLLRPVLRLLGQLRSAALAQQASAARWRRVALGSGAALALLLLLPMPQRTLVQGVIWPPDHAQLRSDEDGFVHTVHAHDGQPVQQGELVLQLANPGLMSSLAQQAARVSALEVGLFEAVPRERDRGGDARAGDALAELAAAQAELERLQERVASLAVRARASGRLALPRAADLPGSFVRRGSLIGQVLTDDPPTVRVAWPEVDAEELQRAGRDVSVRLAASRDDARAATVQRDSWAAVLRLPSAALSTRHGGPIQTDPRDADALQPLHPVVLIDVRLDAPAGAGGERIGERAWVRFDAGASPLLLRGLRSAERLVARRFDPQW